MVIVHEGSVALSLQTEFKYTSETGNDNNESIYAKDDSTAMVI